MTLAPTGTLHVVHEAGGNAVARIDATVLVFVRTQRLTVAALEAIERLAITIDGFRRGPIGALVVVPGDAGLSDNALIARQRAFLRDLVRPDGDVYVSTVILGDSAQSMAMRAVARLFVIGRPSIRVGSSVEDAARWLGARLDVDATQLVRVAGDLLERTGATT